MAVKKDVKTAGKAVKEEVKETAKTVEKTPKEVLSEYLLHQASVMLQTSRLTVQEISQHLGFSSQASFSRFFHSATSLSPKEFRNNNAHSLQ